MDRRYGTTAQGKVAHPTQPLRSRVGRVALAASLAAVTAVVGAVGSDGRAFAVGGTQDAAQVQAAIAVRERYGLPSEYDAVREFVGSAADVGSVPWGVPMTAEEAATLALDARAGFVQDLEAEMLPYLRSLATFAGVP